MAAAGVYVNYLGGEGEQRVREAYGPNLDRLAEIKSRYDPDNFFRMNQNIRPLAGPHLITPSTARSGCPSSYAGSFSSSELGNRSGKIGTHPSYAFLLHFSLSQRFVPQQNNTVLEYLCAYEL